MGSEVEAVSSASPKEIQLDKIMTGLRKKEKESQITEGKITLDEAIEQEINIQVCRFLDAPSHLYKRLCPSVGPSVCPIIFEGEKNAN